MAEKQPLDWLVNFNNFLEKLPENVIKYFKAFTNMGEGIAQEYVDVVCRYAAWRVNITVERIRQKILKKLNDQYGFILKIIDSMNIAQKVISDPIGSISGFFGILAKPIQIAIYYITTLAKELPRLAKNLANIADSLPPPPPNPHINYNAFQLEIKTVSMGELLNADSLPPPEEMFPEPIKPWGKEAFQSSFDSGVDAFNNVQGVKKIVYTPKTRKISGGDESTDGSVSA